MTDQSQPAILIVDDSQLNLDFLHTALKRAGYRVLTAVDGESALKSVEARMPDLILLDIMMPGIDGYETCRRLQANPDTQVIPVIFMTALSSTLDKVKGFEVGAADYLTKPIDAAEMIARVKTHLKIHSLQKELRRQNRDLEQENIKRLRVQEALRESRWRYRLLAENSTDIISRQTLSGNYLYVSPACLTLLGYDLEEMIGKAIYDFICPDDLEKVKAATKPAKDCPSTSTVTYRACCKDGSHVWLETVSKTVCDSEYGRPVEIVAVSRDVTERIEMAEKLRDRNKELDAFSHTVAHDLKNPLGTVISYTDFVLGAWDMLGEEKIVDLVKNVKSVAQTGLNIIGEMLLLARLRKEDVETHKLDMDEIVAQVQQRLQLMIEEFKGEITVPESWPAAVGYGPWVEEVWVNYLSNGLKYGGEPPQLELGATPNGNGAVRFWIKDNGPGISEDQQSGLFAEFIRLDEVRIEGHGLGLSIVQRIIDKLDGRVGVESVVGQGSTFFFELPASDA